MKTNPDGTINQNLYSPSNIKTGWNQKFYYKLERDGVLDIFINIFKKKGNNREIEKDLFEKGIDEEHIDRNSLIGYTYVYNDALEENNGKIKIRDYIIDALLKNNYQFSIKNIIKRSRENLINTL